MSKGALGYDIVIPYVVVQVAKENLKKAAKNMTEAESDALKIVSNTMEVVEEESLQITWADADVIKMLSTMAEA